MKSKANSKANGLMGDLESIKALLEEEDLESATALWDVSVEPVKEPVAEDNIPTLDVPVLDDPIPPVAVTSTSAAALDAILGSDFHDATAEVMTRARRLIEQHPNKWSPQQTDELSEALRVRIDAAVQEWISAALAAHAGELQQRLLTAVRDELARHLESFETDATPS